MKHGTPGFQGSRLTQAREAMGLSVTSLAALIDVSKQAVSQYEKGADAPSQEIFDRLQRTLRQQAMFFLRPPLSSLHTSTRFYRSLAAATKSARTKAESWQALVREVMCYLGKYIELPHPNYPAFDMPSDPAKLGMDRVEILAADLREFWKLGDGPIVDLTSAAEVNGTMIIRHTLDADTLDALSEWLQPENLPFVVLNADKNVAVRSRLDLAHEIGHMVLHRTLTDADLRRSPIFKLIEQQAFRFGAALLLPEHSFLEDLYSLSLDGLCALKPKWKVSIAMMIERLRHLGIVNDEQHRRLRINYSVRQWNRREPLDTDIPVEEPVFLGKAFRLLIQDGVQTPEQIILGTGLTAEWLERLLSLSPLMFAPRGPEVKVLSFRN
jgi:Zn-dependent peptidase ImmA (M78 family)/transcriptional regulator with XRE-family HTH domain